MGSSGGASYYPPPKSITPAIAKDAQIAQQMADDQRQERSLRRGIGSTYSRYNSGAMQTVDKDGVQNGAKKTLG